MSYPSITLYELASAHRADLLREAAQVSLAEQAILAGGSRQWSLPAIVAPMAAAFKRLATYSFRPAIAG